MTTYMRKIKLCIIVYGLMWLLSFTLSGCFPISDKDKESSATPKIFSSFTPTSSLDPLPNHLSTKTPLPSRTATATSSITSTYVPTSTISQIPSFPNGYVLFENDFEADTVGWMQEEDRLGWEVQKDNNGNHFLCNADQSKPTLHIGIGDSHWKNYQLEFDVKDIEFAYTDSQILALRVRENGNARYTFLMAFVGYKSDTQEFSTDASYADIAKILDTGEVIPILEKKLKAPIENQWYTVHVELNEGDLSLRWNDELVIDYQDDEYLAEGSISFYAIYGTCFDNIRVTNIEKSKQ